MQANGLSICQRFRLSKYCQKFADNSYGIRAEIKKIVVTQFLAVLRMSISNANPVIKCQCMKKYIK